jgi:hypothetical protein
LDFFLRLRDLDLDLSILLIIVCLSKNVNKPCQQLDIFFLRLSNSETKKTRNKRKSKSISQIFEFQFHRFSLKKYLFFNSSWNRTISPPPPPSLPHDFLTRTGKNIDKVSILSTFYEQLLCHYSFAEKPKSYTVIREELC